MAPRDRASFSAVPRLQKVGGRHGANSWLAAPAVLALLMLDAASARAEMVRFRYVPVDACGTMQQVASGPDGAVGELFRGFGMRPLPYQRTFRPNQMVTFRHPYNGNLATVPLTLPEGTPRLEHRADRIVYNYGSYVVEVRFFGDGTVDVVYNSGFLRPLQVQ
jgi:hypothetical protein